MKMRKLFLFCLLISIFSVSIFSIAIAEEEKFPCVFCGQKVVPGQHDDCPEMVEKDKKIEELEKELDKQKKQKEMEGKQQDALGVLDLIKVPVKGIYGMLKTSYYGIEDAMGYLCSRCNTWQYGSHICVPETCITCGAIGAHHCPGPTIEIPPETCITCGAIGAHHCPGPTIEIPEEPKEEVPEPPEPPEEVPEAPDATPNCDDCTDADPNCPNASAH